MGTLARAEVNQLDLCISNVLTFLVLYDMGFRETHHVPARHSINYCRSYDLG